MVPLRSFPKDIVRGSLHQCALQRVREGFRVFSEVFQEVKDPLQGHFWGFWKVSWLRSIKWDPRGFQGVFGGISGSVG